MVHCVGPENAHGATHDRRDEGALPGDFLRNYVFVYDLDGHMQNGILYMITTCVSAQHRLQSMRLALPIPFQPVPTLRFGGQGIAVGALLRC